MRTNRRNVLIGSAAGGLGLLLAPLTGGYFAHAAEPRRHALLVGVTEYPNLPPRNRLIGPNTDVDRLRSWLIGNSVAQFSPERIKVLAEGLDYATGLPTLAEIRAAMTELAKAVVPGDIVYLHFSGHGHQQPARYDGEIDGLDEVFMPRDVEIMRIGMREWPNGYVDKDIKADIDAIRRSGAFVWAVFDCCHSATMTRSLVAEETGEVPRIVDLSEVADYNPPERAAGTARNLLEVARKSTLGVDLEPRAEGMGPLVAFYASQTIEPTFELPLPPGSEDSKPMGLFTWTLLSRLAENPTLTYRQLGEAVLASYAASNRTVPIPMFEGDEDALNTQVLGSDTTAFFAQWPLQQRANHAEIAGGAMHGLVPGTKLWVMPDPTVSNDAALGLVEVASTTASRSVLASVEDGVDPIELPPGVWLRRADQVIDFELTVAMPLKASSEAIAVREVLQELAKDNEAPFRLRLVESDASAALRVDVSSRSSVIELMKAQEGLGAISEDILLSAADQEEPELWLLDTGGSISLRPGRTPPSLNLAAHDTEARKVWLREALTRVYRATSLAQLQIVDDLVASRNVEIDVYLKRRSGRDDHDEGNFSISRSIVPQVFDGDEVWVRVLNRGHQAVDIHTLYIGADYTIAPAARPERLHPGNEYDRGQFRIAGNTLGREKLVLALAVAEPMTPVLNLSFLGQDGVKTRGVSRSAGNASGIRDLLANVAYASTTRGGVAMGGQDDNGGGALLIYNLEVTQ